MGRLKEELPDHRGSTPKVIPKGMTKGKGRGALAHPRETKQTPGMDTQTFLEGDTWLTFLRAWFSLWEVATPSQGPSFTLITEKKLISPHFQTSNDSIIRLVMFREIVCVCLGTFPEPEWVRVPPVRACL